MHIWGPVTFTVGQQAIGFFPMAIFQDIGPVTIRFALQSGQGGARTLKIATTLAFAGGRPVVSVNTWNSAIPAVPSQPDSGRGVTRGVYRGNNIEYTYAIRACFFLCVRQYTRRSDWCIFLATGILFTGSTINVITISVASGSSGDTFLVRQSRGLNEYCPLTDPLQSPNIVFDALALF